MIFEQDFAQPHSTNANQEFMETNFPSHTPTLWRYEGKDELFFGPKWDDFWCIERLWGIYSQRVYRNPRPKCINGGYVQTSRRGSEYKPKDPYTVSS